MPSEPHPRQAMTVSYSWAQYIAPSICIWLITSSKTERACANRNASLLDIVRYGRVRVSTVLQHYALCFMQQMDQHSLVDNNWQQYHLSLFSPTSSEIFDLTHAVCICEYNCDETVRRNINDVRIFIVEWNHLYECKVPMRTDSKYLRFKVW